MLTRLHVRDIRLLQIFSAVVEAQGVSAAQDVLGMTQSNISGHLQDLETRLGLTLCERGRGGFRVTPEGEQVYATAQELLTDLGGYEDRLQSIGRGLRGELLIGHMEGYIAHPANPLKHVLQQLTELSRDIFFNIRVGTLEELETQLVGGTLQLAIGTFTRFRDGIDYHPLHEEKQLLLCSASHPLVERADKLRAKDLSSLDYAEGLFGYGSESRILGNPVARVYHLESMLAFLFSGRGVGYLPEQVAQPFLDSGELVALAPGRLSESLTVYLAVRRSALSSPVVSRCIQLILSG